MPFYKLLTATGALMNLSEITKTTKRLVSSNAQIKTLAKSAYKEYKMLHHGLAEVVPEIITYKNTRIMIAITAQCNARCTGCRYGRDFMPGHQLSKEAVFGILDDAAAAGFETIRFYGGEPLLHPDLPEMVEYSASLGLQPYITTNAAILDKKIDKLYAAGIRDITIGIYGFGDDYDHYTGRPGLFKRVENSIIAVREKYGDKVSIKINWLLMKPSCSVEEVHKLKAFAETHQLRVQIDLIHYSLPYFQEGPEGELQFTPEDLPEIQEVVNELIRIKQAQPELITQDIQGLRAMPDSLIKGPAMKVPCISYDMIWIGADGTVQLCYVTFKLGNIHQTSFADMLTSETRRRAAQDAFKLNCPNCHCSMNERVMQHAPSKRLYSQPSF